MITHIYINFRERFLPNMKIRKILSLVMPRKLLLFKITIIFMIFLGYIIIVKLYDSYQFRNLYCIIVMIS